MVTIKRCCKKLLSFCNLSGDHSACHLTTTRWALALFYMHCTHFHPHLTPTYNCMCTCKVAPEYEEKEWGLSIDVSHKWEYETGPTATLVTGTRGNRWTGGLLIQCWAHLRATGPAWVLKMVCPYEGVAVICSLVCRASVSKRDYSIKSGWPSDVQHLFQSGGKNGAH